MEQVHAGLPADGLKVGLTVFIGSANSSIWSNGAIQNYVFLYLLLRQLPAVADVVLVNGGDSDDVTGLLLDDLPIRVVRLHEAVASFDVLIEGGAQVDWQTAAAFRARGGKLVTYQVGNSYVMDVETVLFGRSASRTFDGTRFDAVWTLPHHAPTCRSYWEVMHRSRVEVLPYIWSPLFLDQSIATVPDGGYFGYAPGRAKKRIAILEPNLNVVKTFHYPMLVCERAYRQSPELIQSIHVTNTAHITHDPVMQNFMCHTDAGQAGVATIEDRYPIAHFMALYADVVVAHQWQNALNNMYLDVLYGGYPLIHNSTMVDAGYYYPEFDAEAGAKVLLEVLTNHDSQIEAYRTRADAWLATMRWDYAPNVRAYEAALLRLFA